MTAPEPILFPDAERLAIAVLTTALGNRSEEYAQDVYLDVTEPQTRRRRQVVVRRDGGRRLDLVREAPRLTFRVWGRDDTETGDLARLVAALLGAAADGSTPLLRVTTSGPYRVPGTDYRLLTAEFTVKGSPLS
jgi:hypothetical protein